MIETISIWVVLWEVIGQTRRQESHREPRGKARPARLAAGIAQLRALIGAHAGGTQAEKRLKFHKQIQRLVAMRGEFNPLLQHHFSQSKLLRFCAAPYVLTARPTILAVSFRGAGKSGGPGVRRSG